jgi:hypothetical protein
VNGELCEPTASQPGNIVSTHVHRWIAAVEDGWCDDGGQRSDAGGRDEHYSGGLYRTGRRSGVCHDNKKGTGQRQRGSSPRGVPGGGAVMLRRLNGGSGGSTMLSYEQGTSRA